jgi:hypothetical protein
MSANFLCLFLLLWYLIQSALPQPPKNSSMAGREERGDCGSVGTVHHEPNRASVGSDGKALHSGLELVPREQCGETRSVGDSRALVFCILNIFTNVTDGLALCIQTLRQQNFAGIMPKKSLCSSGPFPSHRKSSEREAGKGPRGLCAAEENLFRVRRSITPEPRLCKPAEFPQIFPGLLAA